MKKYALLVVLALPVSAGAVTSNNGSHIYYTHHLTSAKRAEVRLDNRAIDSDQTGLHNAYENLHNDRQHGNRSEIAADRAQISELQNQLRTDTLELRSDGGYKYVSRRDDLNGWGDHSDHNQHYNGWGH